MTNNDTFGQVAYWNELHGDKWVRLQERIDLLLGPFGDSAIAILDPKPGLRILDIGCGCGSSTLALAEAVGLEGAVIGADISKPMIARARERAAAQSAAPVEIIEADIQRHEFAQGEFDAIFSRFGVMFFDDPVAAFRNILHAAKPGARLAFATWRDKQENPWVTEVAKAAKLYIELPPPPAPDEPGQFAFADDAKVLGVLKQAGWQDPEALKVDFRLKPGKDLDDAIGFLTQMGPTGKLLIDAGPAVADKVAAALRTALAPYVEDGEQAPSMPAAGWVFTAKAPV